MKITTTGNGIIIESKNGVFLEITDERYKDGLSLKAIDPTPDGQHDSEWGKEYYPTGGFRGMTLNKKKQVKA